MITNILEIASFLAQTGRFVSGLIAAVKGDD
jgi:hypothetical protein